nr:hypothetical protein [Pseudarthrobacter phenanthrenivorans]
MHRPRTPFHFLRASALSTAVLALAGGAHLAAGGVLPAPSLLLAVLALTALGATAATRLRLGFPVLAALLGGAQLVLHEVFAAFTVTGARSAATGTASHGGHGGWPAAPAPVLDHLYGADPLYGSGTESGLMMLAAHVLATAGSAFLLAKGEDALWALAAWLRPLVELPRPAVFDDGPAPSLPATPAAVPLRPWRNLRQDSRRGPPSAVVLSS